MTFNIQSLLVAVGLLFAVSGCLTYPGTGFTPPADSLEDEANKSFVAQAQADYEARLKFRRKVEIVPSDRVNVFLSNHAFNDVHVAKKRELLTACESVLREKVGSLRDFEVISSEAKNGIPVAATSGEGGSSEIYRLSFEIADIQVREKEPLIRGSSHQKSNEHSYYVTVKVDVTLTAPSGKQVFKYGSVGSSDLQTFMYTRGNSWLFNQTSMVNDATINAVSAVLNSYARDFAPPMYVKELTSGGAFARISAGSAYGILPGQRIEFYRNRLRELPTLQGEVPKTELVKELVGYGVVGVRNCPIEADTAWVFVNGNDKPAKEGRPDLQAVRLWTSARIVD